MLLLEKLSINKKITAIFNDGTQKMNLGISSVAGQAQPDDSLHQQTWRGAAQYAGVEPSRLYAQHHRIDPCDCSLRKTSQCLAHCCQSL
jgi:hypothetical protein